MPLLLYLPAADPVQGAVVEQLKDRNYFYAFLPWPVHHAADYEKRVCHCCCASLPLFWYITLPMMRSRPTIVV